MTPQARAIVAAATVGGLLLLLARGARAAQARPDGTRAPVRPAEGNLDSLDELLPYIAAEAREAGAPAYLVAAHVMVESNADPGAIRVEVQGALESSARRALQRDASADPSSFMQRLQAGRVPTARTASVGLMQILPATAEGEGFRGDWSLLLDPLVNLRYGARYVARQVTRFGGVIEDAAAAYNAGAVKLAPPAVAQALIVAADEARLSPCAFIASSKNAVVQAAIEEAGGAFQTATSSKGARELREAGRTMHCNIEYVEAVWSWIARLENDAPELFT